MIFPTKNSAQLATKWLSYSQKTYAQIWAFAPILAEYQYFSTKLSLLVKLYQIAYYLQIFRVIELGRHS